MTIATVSQMLPVAASMEASPIVGDRVELRLLTTLKCNLKCSYCSLGAGDVLGSQSELKYDIDQLAAFVARHLAGKEVYVTFYGGDARVTTTHLRRARGVRQQWDGKPTLDFNHRQRQLRALMLTSRLCGFGIRDERQRLLMASRAAMLACHSAFRRGKTALRRFSSLTRFDQFAGPSRYNHIVDMAIDRA